MTVAEWVLMRQLLDEEALAPSRLAERMGMTRGAITKLADRLIAKSLLVRAADPEDGRAQTLALTPAGRALVPELGGAGRCQRCRILRSPDAGGPRGAAPHPAGRSSRSAASNPCPSIDGGRRSQSHNERTLT